MSRSKLKLDKRPSRRDLLLVGLGAVIALLGVQIVNLVDQQRVPVKYTGQGITAPWIPATVRHWQQPIDEMAKKYNLDPDLLAIIMTMESGGYAQADSGFATGLMQVTPLTGKDIASKYLKTPVKHYNLLEPRTSIEFGAAYLAMLRDNFGTAKQGPSYDTTVELMAAAYNGGPGAAQSILKGEGLTSTQTVVYSRDAFNMWRERHAHNSPTFDRWKERGGSTLLDQAKASQQ
jgi:hypothetical protein